MMGQSLPFAMGLIYDLPLSIVPRFAMMSSYGGGNYLVTALLSQTMSSMVPPNALINEMGPLPSIPSWAPEAMTSADGTINKIDHSKLTQGILADFIYSYGPNPDRITTQTQNNIPNKVQRIIPKLFIPAAQSDGSAFQVSSTLVPFPLPSYLTHVQDPILEHATNDGDLVFSLKMNYEMSDHSSRYVIYPLGYSERAVKLVNLATVNYLLWGLQVGSLMPGNPMWLKYFQYFCKTDHADLMHLLSQKKEDNHYRIHEMIWNFLQTYVAPFGVQHGFDTQGGQHEGSSTSIVTNAVDYVSSFAVEGKLLHVNNLWKACDVYEGDDVVLALRYMQPKATPILFNLSSSSRSHRCTISFSLSFFWGRGEVLISNTMA